MLILIILFEIMSHFSLIYGFTPKVLLYRHLSVLKSSNFKQLPVEELFTETDVLHFTESLKNFACKKLVLHDQDVVKFISILNGHVNKMDSASLSDTIWSLGKLNLKGNVLDEDFLNLVYGRIITVSNTSSKVDFLRILSGFISIGLKWDMIPLRVQYCALNSQLDCDKVDGRQISQLTYSLGLMGATKSSLSPENLIKLQSTLVIGMSDSTFNAHSLPNVVAGLSKIGLNWDNDLSERLKSEILQTTSRSVGSLQMTEVCSLVQSFAKMKVPWSDLPQSFKGALVNSLINALPGTGRREIINILWSLGKLGLSWRSAVGEEAEMLSLVLGRLDATVIRMLTPFDLESLFVGLGLMEVPSEELEPVRAVLFEQIGRALPTMNIFCLHNTLWGLARIKMPVVETDVSLSRQLLEKTIAVMHTLLPEQIGDVLWSLGSLGYRADRGDLAGADSDRLQAILSRMLGRLTPRAAAFVFWGLGKMGYRWRQFQVPTPSLPNGRLAEPLADAATRYLTGRVGGMKEQDLAVLLFALGLLKVSWADLPATLREKVYNRIVKVAPFFSARSLSNLLWGLGKADLKWGTLPKPAQEALLSLLTGSRGLDAMNAHEVVQCVHGLSLSSASWLDVGPEVQLSIINALKRVTEEVSCRALSTALDSLYRMGCPAVLDLRPARAIVTAGLPGASQQCQPEDVFEPNVEGFLYWLQHQQPEWWVAEVDRLTVVLEKAQQRTDYRGDREAEMAVDRCRAILRSWKS